MFVVTADDTHTVRKPLLPYHLFCQTAHLGKIEVGTGVIMIVVGIMIYFNMLIYLDQADSTKRS